MECELCDKPGGWVLWQDDSLRVVLVDDADYPGFCRVIWAEHVVEMTELGSEERGYLMRTVFMVESVLRQIMKPDKMNLASMGNVVPHIHWHVIPRFVEDRHFPQPVWGQPQRPRLISVQIDRLVLKKELQAVLPVTKEE